MVIGGPVGGFGCGTVVAAAIRQSIQIGGIMIGSIRFAGDLHPALVIGFALVAASAVAWLYLRESRTVASPYSFLLPGLRASAVALAILILAAPVWHRRITVGTLGQVIFAIDTSQSMSMNDSAEPESSPSRLDRSLNLLTGDSQNAGWLETLSKTHLVDVIAFSSGEPSIVWSSRDNEGAPGLIDLDANGLRTDLASGMSLAHSGLAPTHADAPALPPQTAAVVFLTDGRDNIGGSPLDAAEQLKSSGIHIHTIGIGSQDEPIDVGIVDVIRPESVASDGQLNGEVLLKSVGVSNDGGSQGNVTVRIESGGKIVWQNTVPASSDQQTVPFVLDVESILGSMQADSPRGVRRSTVVMDLRAVVEKIDGDTHAENNVMPFRVAASTRDRRLLILDGSSRWETRYLRNLFSRDPAWTVETVLFGPGTDMPIVRRGDRPGEFPDSDVAIAGYDAIILGEIPPEQFEKADADRIIDFVTRGGGLIVIDGRYGRLRAIAQNQLPALIPVRYTDAQPMAVKSIRPNSLAEDHPVLNLWGDTEERNRFWENLPAPPLAPMIEPQEGAEVWADVVDSDQRRAPWLVTRLYGAGRVFYLSTDQTWRWRYKVADRFHARFWNQLLNAVMQPPYSANDDYVALGTDKIEYEAGQSSTIRARLQDPSGQPVGDATVDALLIADDRIFATVPLAVDDPARGTYRGQTPPLQTGAYSIRIRASGFDSQALQASTPIWVGTRDAVELARVSLDQDTLKQVAKTGGGVYLHESSSDQIIEHLRPLSNGMVVESDVLVWQSFYWFWAIILLLALEWWLRKRAGLV